MSRVTRIAPHLTVAQVKEKLDAATRPWLCQRWMVIYTALLDPRPAAKIARQLGISQALVAKLSSHYKRLGPAGIETSGPGGRRHQYLTTAEEVTFLAPFLDQAAAGQIVTTKTIHHAFEARVGHAVEESTVYRLLERHQWRKIMPRAQHPQADPEAQAAFKKLRCACGRRMRNQSA